MRRTSAVRVAFLGVLSVALLVASCTTSSPPGGGAPRSRGDGDLASRIDERLASILDANNTPVAVLVQVDNKVVYARYDDTPSDDYRDVASVTKSVLSILVGIALSEGYLESVDQTLAELLPDYADTMTAPVAGTTLRQVLTMTGGFVGEQYPGGFAFTHARDPVRSILNGTVVRPGRQFIYSSASPHLVSIILENATQMSVLDYARSRLFDPLGIPSRPAAQPVLTPSTIDAYYQADFAWPVDRQHHQLGWGRLKLRLTDMAKLGTLYLNHGRWNGEQVVPASWVRDSTAAQVNIEGVGPTHSYGYQWWVDDAEGNHSFEALGFGGQAIEVFPDRDLVLRDLARFRHARLRHRRLRRSPTDHRRRPLLPRRPVAADAAAKRFL